MGVSSERIRFILVTADDFGLTKTNVDSIIKTHDWGPLNRVSLIANGYAFEYAIEEWKKRRERLSIALHLNLTEGCAVSDKEEVPLLVTSNGGFRFGPIGLYMYSLLTFGKKKTDLERQIRQEVRAQIQKMRMALGEAPLIINGHQHVQMIPLVMSCILSLREEQAIREVRISKEVFFIPDPAWLLVSFKNVLEHIGLNVLSSYLQWRYRTSGVLMENFIIGSLVSGAISVEVVKRAKAEAERRAVSYLEIVTHPGEVLDEEMDSWQGDKKWHVSPLRAIEGKALLDPNFAAALKGQQEASALLKTGRYLVSGGIATVLNLLVLYVCTETLHFWYIASAFFAYAVATIVSFALQKFWTFSSHRVKGMKREFFLYALNVLLGLIFSLVTLHLAVEVIGLWYMLAQCCIVLLLAIWNFFFFRIIVFNEDTF